MTYAKYVIPFLIACSSLSAITSDWTVDGNGNWTTPTTNWSTTPVIPTLIDDVAQFSFALTGNAIISVNTAGIVVGTVTISNATPFTYTINTNPLTFQTSSGSALISIPAGGGAVTHSISSDVVLTSNLNVDLNVANGISMSGAISGPGGITLTGSTGMLDFFGGPANTYTGLTTINIPVPGELSLTKTAGTTSIPGDVLILDGNLVWSISNQVADTSTITLGGAGAVFALSGLTETIGHLSYQSGTFGLAGGTLTLASNTTALTMRNVAIADPLIFSGSGAVVFDATSNGTATITGALTLGLLPRNFNIGNGTAAIDMDISGVISGGPAGGIIKTGAGRLEFSGGANNTYTGLTAVNGGELSLNRAGFTSIPGSVIINGGTLRLLTADQIVNTADVILQSGSFNMGAFNETINALDFEGGTLPFTSTLTLTSPTVALSMRGGTSLATGTVSLTGAGDVVFDAAVNGTATIGTLNLGGVVHEFNIGEGAATPDMNITGVISGAGGGVTKIGAGTLQFSGAAANTYTALTTVTAGTLNLAKSAATDAIPGNVTIDGGSVTLANNEQIANAAVMTITAGSFSQNGFTETFTTLIYQGGGVFQDGGLLNLSSGGNALTMRNTALNGPIATTGGGTIVFDATNNGTATIDGTLNLSGFAPVVFNIANGTAVEDMVISSVISNGGITKTGAGTLVLLGANTYGLATTVTTGTLQGNTTSLQGVITNNANLVFDQAFDGTFNGTMGGAAGTLVKQDSGTVTFNTPQAVVGVTTIAGGTLLINSNFTGGGAINVNAGATLGGLGPIIKDVNVSGFIAPGNNAIGTLNITGNVVMQTGSTQVVELNNAVSDLINVTGAFTIQPLSTFDFIPEPDNYVNNHIVVAATGGVTGTYAFITDPFPLFRGNLIYQPNAIILQILLLPVSSLPNLNSNAVKVANCLDAINPPLGSDLADVINSLRFLPTEEAINRALLEMQPSAFASLAVVKEDTTLYIRNAIYDRLEVRARSCMEEETGYSFWLAPLIGVTEEKKHNKAPGYNVLTPGIAVGFDGFLLSRLQMGGSLGYTNSDLTWKSKRGDARIQGVYGAAYGRYAFDVAYLESTLIGGYDYYSTRREIKIGGGIPLHRRAKGHHHGFEGSAHLKGVLQLAMNQTTLSPFASVDFLYVYEGSFTENGAGSLNLYVSSKHSNLLLSEAGMDLSRCFHTQTKTITPFIQASGIWENRFSGKREQAGLEGCTLNVIGYYPSRIVLGTSAGLNVKWALKNAPKVSFFYKGKWATKYQDHSFTLELIY